MAPSASQLAFPSGSLPATLGCDTSSITKYRNKESAATKAYFISSKTFVWLPRN